MDKAYLQFILAYDFGEQVSDELGLACDEFFELAGEIADRYKQSRKEAGKDEYYESFQYFVGKIAFADVWKDLVEQKRGNSRDTLGDFLETFNFSYKVYQNDTPGEQALRLRLVEDGDLDEADINKPLIGLVDDQGANWGDIENGRFLLNKGLAVAIIERMDIYVEDQVVKEFEEALERRDLDPAKYESSKLEGFSDEEFIVPLTRFDSVDQARQFLDWVEKREHSTMREDGNDFVVKNVMFLPHDDSVMEDVLSGKCDTLCRISLEKAPSAAYEKTAKDADGRHYEPDNFFIEATVGREGPNEPWQASNWFLFYLDVNGNSHLLNDTLELPDAWKYIQSEREKVVGNKSPEKRGSLDTIIAAASRVVGDQQRPEQTSRKNVER